MTQEQWIVLLLRADLVSGFCALTGWIVLYSFLAAWWRYPIGRTLVAKTALVAAMFVPSILAMFFKLSRHDSLIAGWVDVVLIGAVTPVMCWRSLVWWRLHKAGQLPRDGDDEERGEP